MRTDLDRAFDPLDLLEGPDLRAEIERRASAPAPAIAPPPRRRRVTAALVAVALFAVVAVFAWAMLNPLGTRPVQPSPAPQPANDWQGLATGWTRLPDVPASLQGSVRIWAGGTLIVWGGNEGDGVGQSALGWRLDAANGPWRTLAPSPLAPRSWAASAWTGSELLIWGGASGSDPMTDPLADGAAYDPASDTWRRLPEAPIGARSPLVSVWTGSQLLIWGEGPARSPGGAMDGAAYQPETDSWSTIPQAPRRINDGHAVWTGTEMAVIGSELLDGNQAITGFGEAYEPATGTWRQLAPTNLDSQATDIAWDGTRVVVADYLGNVKTYDPGSNLWADLPDPPLPQGEGGPSLVVAGGQVIEGLNGRTVMMSTDQSGWSDITHAGHPDRFLSAGRFAIGVAAGDPRAWAYLPPPLDHGWTRLSEPPVRRSSPAEVWDGKELLVWGGSTGGGGGPSPDGFALDPTTNTWRSLPPAPIARSGASGVWTGSEAIFWGGFDGETGAVDGAAYDPATDSWRTIPAAPLAPRDGVGMVWTGAEVFVWGGGHEDTANQGALYDPATDSWRKLSSAPFGLNLLSALWTGDEVIMFGSDIGPGNHSATPHPLGLTYDPTGNTWGQVPPAKQLSPQATSAGWVRGRLVAYDYTLHAASFDPAAALAPGGAGWSATGGWEPPGACARCCTGVLSGLRDDPWPLPRLVLRSIADL